MARGKVTESYSDMFIVGERDIAAIVKIADKFGYNDGVMNIDIVSHANLAVEKFLKGYLFKNNIDVEKTHDLDFLSTMAFEKNANLKTILDDCDKLNIYGSGVKYDPNLNVNESIASDSVKLLENIYNFEEIKKIRDELRNTNKKYPQEENLLKKVIKT
jgi:HEPN domain-containing protein